MKYEVPEVKDLNIEVNDGATIITLNGKQIVLTEGEKLSLELVPTEVPEVIESEVQVDTAADPEYDEYDLEFKRERRKKEPETPSTPERKMTTPSCGVLSDADDADTKKNAASDNDNVAKLEDIALARKSSFGEDFAAAMKISMTDFRGSKFIVRSLKNTWYDRQLQTAVHKINGTGLSYFIAIIGAAVLMLAGSKMFTTPVTTALVIGFLLVDYIIINPLLIYFIAPKPIKAHIKQIDKMTDEERAVYEEDKNRLRVSRTTQRAINRHDDQGKFILKD